MNGQFRLRSIVAVLCLLVGFSVQAAGEQQGGSGAIAEMSNVMIGLQHYPSDAEKARLKQIAADANTSAQEKTIATALMNMEHNVSSGDKAKLKQIADDASAPANVRELAGILMNMSHKPSAEDKAKLQKLAAQ